MWKFFTVLTKILGVKNVFLNDCLLLHWHVLIVCRMKECVDNLESVRRWMETVLNGEELITLWVPVTGSIHCAVQIMYKSLCLLTFLLLTFLIEKQIYRLTWMAGWLHLELYTPVIPLICTMLGRVLVSELFCVIFLYFNLRFWHFVK